MTSSSLGHHSIRSILRVCLLCVLIICLMYSTRNNPVVGAWGCLMYSTMKHNASTRTIKAIPCMVFFQIHSSFSWFDSFTDVGIVVEMDRILRFGGWAIVRDKVEILNPLESILKSMRWEIKLSYAQDTEGILCAQKMQ